MKPNAVLVAKSSPTAVLVSGQLDDRICVIGASLDMSARPGDYVKSFTIYLPDDVESGVVALSVSSHRFSQKGDKHYPSFSFLLAVRSSHGEALVNLEEQWVSPKLVQVYEYHLEVQIGEERFSTRKPYSDGSERVRYVPDANLLCRYLVDQATADEVRAAAEEAVVETSRKERIVELEVQVKQLEELVERLKKTRRTNEERIEELQARIQRHLAEKVAFHQSATEWRTYAEMLRSVLSTRLFLRKDLRQALREFPQKSMHLIPGA